MSKSPAPSIYEFDNYRNYLHAVFQTRKERNRRFSLGAWSSRLELKSSSALIMILKGDRNPGAELTEKIVGDLSLRSNEAEYFRDLISYEKAHDNPHLRALLREKLSKRHPQKEFRPLETRVYRTISEWYYLAIRELADLPDFQEDTAWIQSRLHNKVSKPQIQEALATLESLELLARDEKGRLGYRANTISTFDVPDEGIRRYHDQILNLSREALTTVPALEREITGVTFTCKKSDLPKIKEQIRNFVNSLLNTSEREHDSVFHVEVACIPLSKEPLQ